MKKRKKFFCGLQLGSKFLSKRSEFRFERWASVRSLKFVGWPFKGLVYDRLNKLETRPTNGARSQLPKLKRCPNEITSCLKHSPGTDQTIKTINFGSLVFCSAVEIVFAWSLPGGHFFAASDGLGVILDNFAIFSSKFLQRLNEFKRRDRLSPLIFQSL